MEWPKVKNIIIVILLLVNGFLLILVGGQWYKARAYQKNALTGAAAVLEQNGIQVSGEALEKAGEGTPVPVTVARSESREGAVVRALLGNDAICTDRSGGLYVYAGSGGSAILRANGDFTVTLSGRSGGGTEKEMRRRAEELLQDMGVEAEYIKTDTAGETTRLSYRQTLSGENLYNCGIVFEYGEDGLRAVRGTMLICDVPAPAGETVLSASTMFVRFLEGVRERRDLCSAITDIAPGYLAAQSFGADAVLTPVWLVSTDISDYYLNSVTGELTLAN